MRFLVIKILCLTNCKAEENFNEKEHVCMQTNTLTNRSTVPLVLVGFLPSDATVRGLATKNFLH